MWTLVGARIARFWIVRLGSVHLHVGTRDGHALGIRLNPHGKQVRKDNTQQSDIPSLGIRGKSWGSVRESDNSVERLKECSGARACTFGKLGARAYGWSAREARGRRQARGQVRGRAAVRVGRHAGRTACARDVRGCAG
ncbi:hypothetical protein CRG98_002224 [Punica granatum]|uniref:Uncharacterized protein n=1 Tax=Punica granatum TaxID=22663 RepID=A0A2I0L9M8_PUNGR|nr:hypothetical protein CRG98_002224 [Punica granatum]